MIIGTRQIGDQRVGEVVRHLGKGADDVIQFPIHIGELEARMRAAIRRDKLGRGISSVFNLGSGLVLNSDQSYLAYKGKPITLAGAEYQVFSTLAGQAGVYLTMGFLRCHAYEKDMTQSFLKATIFRLRTKIVDAVSQDYSYEDISTMGNRIVEVKRGHGYRVPKPIRLGI